MKIRALLTTALLALGAAAHADERNWWQAFREPALDVLLASSGKSESDPHYEAVAAYVEARVNTIRLAQARLLHEALRRQQALLDPASSDADAVTRELDALEGRMAQLQSAALGNLQSLAGALGQRESPQRMLAMLQSALDTTRLPMPEFELPQEVSGFILRQRADVQQAEAHMTQAARTAAGEQLRLVRYLHAISAPIAASPTAAPAKGNEPEDVLEAARAEIGARLWQVGIELQQATKQREAVNRLGVAYRELPPGTGESEALRAAAKLLREEDRLAEAVGRVALAWVAFERSIGGVTVTRTRDLVEIPPQQH